MSNLEHFKTLRIGPSASISQIKRAYKALAKQYHPDKNRNESARDHSISFPKIQEAYEQLRKHHQKKSSKRICQSTLKQSLIERLENLAELMDSESSSSEQDYLLHRTLQARSLKEESERLGKPTAKRVPTSIVPTTSKLEAIRRAINNGLQQTNSSSSEETATRCPSQQEILLMKDLHIDIFQVHRPPFDSI